MLLPTVDNAYEHVQKRTFFPMLIMVLLFLPLLIGIILLYPWTKSKREKRKSPTERQEEGEDDEKTELIPVKSNQNSSHSD